MAVLTLYRVETFERLVWTGKDDFFSYDELDAAVFDTEDEADKASKHLEYVCVEAFQRISGTPQPKTYNATEARAA